MAKRLIIVGIDGCHQGILYDLIAKGEAPFMRKLVDEGTKVAKAATMFPATTGPCCSSLYTGCWYRSHGVLDNEWFDRFSMPVRARSYIAGMRYALEAMDRKLFGFPTIFLPDRGEGGSFNNDLNVPTIYEEFTKAGKISYTLFHYIGRGATRWMRPSRMDMLRYGYVEQYTKPFQIYEKFLVSRALKISQKKMPDLLSIYFGCNDGHSHRHGVPAQKEYLRDFVDPELARLDAGLRAMHPDDEFYWAITADHGQTNLTDDDRDKCIWFDTFNNLLNDAGFTIIQRGLSDLDHTDADAVSCLGNGAEVSFYLKSRKTKDWRSQPDFQEELVPLLNNFLRANDALAPYSDWKFRGYLDFLLTRTDFKEPYRVYTNKPPFKGPGWLIDLKDFFAGRVNKYVKPIERIRGFDDPRNADIILVLNYADHFNINEPDGFHLGQHGSLLADDSLIPMIFSGPGIKHEEIPEAFSIDFAPTAAHLVGVKMPSADGGILPII